MLEFSPHLEQYIQDFSKPQDPILEELERETHLKTNYPQMLSGPVLGGFLELISKLIQPENILEIGTFTGYSSICLARGLGKKGILTTIESNDELQELSDLYFQKAGLSSRIRSIHGNALEVIPGLRGPFDLVFVDGEKTEYSLYYKEVMEKTRTGSLVLADNALWSGKVAKKESRDQDTDALRSFNKMVSDDPRVENVILSIRDGVNMIRVL